MKLKEIRLRLKYDFKVPIDVRCVSPDVFAGKGIDDIGNLQVYEGNRARILKDLFIIEGEVGKTPSETQITIEGGSPKLRWIGYRMNGGKISVEGDVGHYAAARMHSGIIEVQGNAGSRLGAKMEGGNVEVFGNAGDHAGAYYWGEKPGMGMKGGTIVIHGNAGSEIGGGMSKGTILVEGNVGQLPGIDMTGGRIDIEGDCEGKPGARMKGGRITILGRVPMILLSFYINNIVESTTIGPKKVRVEGPFYLFQGDVMANIRCGGRFYVSARSNPHLKPYEKFLS